MRKLIGTAIAFVLVSATAFGTSFYLINQGGILYLAGDTRDYSPQLGIKDTHCKIFVNDRYVLIAAGALAEYFLEGGTKQAPIGHYVYRLDEKMNQVFSQPRSREEMSQLIAVAMRDAQYESFVAEKAGRDHTVKPDLDGIRGQLFMFEGSHLSMQEIDAIPTSEGTKIYLVPDVKPAVEIQQGDLKYFAIHEAMSDPSRPSIANVRRNPITSLDKILAIEHSHNKDLVDKPYTILKFSRDGSSWVQNGAVCESNTHLSTKAK
jgi:hypothetical protein